MTTWNRHLQPYSISWLHTYGIQRIHYLYPPNSAKSRRDKPGTDAFAVEMQNKDDPAPELGHRLQVHLSTPSVSKVFHTLRPKERSSGKGTYSAVTGLSIHFIATICDADSPSGNPLPVCLCSECSRCEGKQVPLISRYQRGADNVRCSSDSHLLS